MPPPSRAVRLPGLNRPLPRRKPTHGRSTSCRHAPHGLVIAARERHRGAALGPLVRCGEVFSTITVPRQQKRGASADGVFAGPESAARVTTESRQGEPTASCRFCGAPAARHRRRPRHVAALRELPAGRPAQRHGAVLPAARLRLPGSAGSCSSSSTSAPSTSSPSTPTSRRSPTAGCSTPVTTRTKMIDRFGYGPTSHVIEIASNDGYLLQ